MQIFANNKINSLQKQHIFQFKCEGSVSQYLDIQRFQNKGFKCHLFQPNCSDQIVKNAYF